MNTHDNHDHCATCRCCIGVSRDSGQCRSCETPSMTPADFTAAMQRVIGA